jgi:hypothetical protein
VIDGDFVVFSETFEAAVDMISQSRSALPGDIRLRFCNFFSRCCRGWDSLTLFEETDDANERLDDDAEPGSGIRISESPSSIALSIEGGGGRS